MTSDETPPTAYPASWRPKHMPVPDEELPTLEVETYIASLTPGELQEFLTRAKGLR